MRIWVDVARISQEDESCEKTDAIRKSASDRVDSGGAQEVRDEEGKSV